MANGPGRARKSRAPGDTGPPVRQCSVDLRRPDGGRSAPRRGAVSGRFPGRLGQTEDVQVPSSVPLVAVRHCDEPMSGGVSPDLWLPGTPMQVFQEAVLRWLEQKRQTFRLIANAGDQVPPGAEEQRIFAMRELVEEYGAF